MFLAQLPAPVDAARGRSVRRAGREPRSWGYCPGRNPASAKAMVTALRALLRFLHVAGWTAVPLAAAVPAVAAWRLSSLPRGLDAAEVARLLAGCDRDSSWACGITRS